MNKDEEYVRSVWAWVQVRLAEPFEGIAQGQFTVRLPRLPFSQVGFDTEAEAWSAAAEFTRDWQEQVRQVSEEIHRLQCLLMPSPETNVREATDEAWPEGAVCEYVRETFAYARTIARLEAELTRLTAGMKPEAL